MKVYIYCGVPGSGKTTLIKERHPSAVVCSADDHFIVDGEYKFDPSKLPAAHAECLRKFTQLVLVPRDWPDTLVVDNTNTTVAEIAPYAALALAYGHELTVVTVECDPDVAAARNTHGVSMSACRAMHLRMMKRELPPWWTQEVVPAFVDQAQTPRKHLKVGDVVTILNLAEPRRIIELYNQAEVSGGFKLDKPTGGFVSWNEDDVTSVKGRDA